MEFKKVTLSAKQVELLHRKNSTNKKIEKEWEESEENQERKGRNKW